MKSYKSPLVVPRKNLSVDIAPAVQAQQPEVRREVAGARRLDAIVSCLEIPFMHKGLIVACTSIGLLLGWLAITVWPKVYKSEAKLMIKVGRANVSLDPVATTGSVLMTLQKTQQEEIATALELLRSREVAQKVVATIGADVILSGKLDHRGQGSSSEPSGNGVAAQVRVAKEHASAWVRSLILQSGVKEILSERERAVRSIQSSVAVDSPRGSAVVAIHGKAENPAMAQAIVKNVSEIFMDEYLKGMHTQGSFEFFEDQATTVEMTLNGLVADRATFMQEQQLVSIEANRELLRSQMEGVERDLGVTAGQLQQAVAEVKDLSVRILSTDDEVVSEKLRASDNAWTGMRQQFFELELEEQSLSATLSPEHPRLKIIRAHLAGARDLLEGLDSERVDESTTLNPVKVSMQKELNGKKNLTVGLQSIMVEYEAQYENLLAQGSSLLEKERHLTKLERDIEIETRRLTIMRTKLEEARVKQALHSNKFSNVHTFQPATLVERAVSPDKKMLGLGFVFFGFMTGLFLSFVKGGAGAVSSLRTVADVELKLGVPVVACVPKIKQHWFKRKSVEKGYREISQKLLCEIVMSQQLHNAQRARSVGIIGVDVDAGTSTLAVQLALSSQDEFDMRTLLVDTDSQRRSISKMFGLNGTPGLVELVGGLATPGECVQKEKDGNLEIIASAGDSCDQSLSCRASVIDQALRAYLPEFELLIVDLPAASQPSQAAALAQHLDCVLVVVESEKTESVAAERLLNRLAISNTEVLGVVLTKKREYLPRFVRSFVPTQWA